MDVYVIDPASVARHQMAAWSAIMATGLLSAVIISVGSRKAWWSIPLIVLLVSTLAGLLFGARPEFSLRYLTEVVLPLALLGAPSALIGSAVGLGIRRWRRRRGPS